MSQGLVAIENLAIPGGSQDSRQVLVEQPPISFLGIPQGFFGVLARRDVGCRADNVPFAVFFITAHGTGIEPYPLAVLALDPVFRAEDFAPSTSCGELGLYSRGIVRMNPVEPHARFVDFLRRVTVERLNVGRDEDALAA